MKMQTLRRLLSALVLGGAVSGAWANVDVSGVSLDETVTVGGVPLHLNGAGYRKRGYFKIDVTASSASSWSSSRTSRARRPRATS